MMKLKFEVQPRLASETRIVLKPIGDCGLYGTVVYDLPRRASEQMQPGSIVEAVISLPDHYPLRPSNVLWESANQRGWRGIGTAPTNELILLGAFDYFGSGKHAVAIGRGTLPPERYLKDGALPSWRADLGHGEQDFTPTHWQPLPRLVAN